MTGQGPGYRFSLYPGPWLLLSVFSAYRGFAM